MSLFGFGTVEKGDETTVVNNGDGTTAPTMVTEIAWFDVLTLEAVAVVRAAATRTGRDLGLDDAGVCDLGIVVSELGYNICKHADGGRVAFRAIRRSGVVGLEIIVVDSGPGVPRLPWESDNQSDAFISAIHRANRHDGYSLPGRGTVVTVQFWPRGVYPTGLAAAGLTRPMPGESVSGDQFAVIFRDDGPMLMVVDGLGHGPLAAEAATAVVEAFHVAASPHRTDGNPAHLVEEIHQSITHTRGAAVAIAKLEPATGVVRFAGLGNISAAVVTAPESAEAGRTGMVSQHGVVGHQKGEIYESCYPLRHADLVVLHSDGVTDRWELAAYPGLAHHEPLVVATTLLRDAGVRRDDACVLVARSM